MKNRPFLIFVFLVLAILAVLYKGYKDGKFESTKSPNQKALTETKTVSLPVDLNNQNVSTVYLAYNFFGPIKELKTTDKGTQIILDTSNNSLPNFIIDKGTKVLTVTDGNEMSPANEDDLKPGLRISISTTYELKTSFWMTRNVYIIK